MSIANTKAKLYMLHAQQQAINDLTQAYRQEINGILAKINGLEHRKIAIRDQITEVSRELAGLEEHRAMGLKTSVQLN